jgi:hypothetical protein
VPLVWGVSGVSNLASMDILNPPQLFYKIGKCRWVCLKHQLPNQALMDTSTCVLTEEVVDDMIFILRDYWKEKRFICSESNFLTNDSSHRHAKMAATRKKNRKLKQVREEDDEDFEEDL